jgi:hypothetical protein
VTRAFALLIPLLVACGQSDGSQPGGTDTFIPLQRDFANYRQWRTFDLGVAAADSVHPEGRRVVYLNQAPPMGSTAFPAGTILVKTVTPSDGSATSIFAMAKRGGTYNARGAVGWEWFELHDGSDGTALIVWRGITPPSGEGYGNVVGGACNTCHGLHQDNDYVASSELLLGTF